MSHLLIQNTFDFYRLVKAEITTFCTFSIDGSNQKEYYKQNSEESPAALSPYAGWDQVRPFCLNLIRGKQTPQGFSFVFLLPEDQAEKLRLRACPDFNPDLVGGMLLTIRYKNGILTLTTGISLKGFTLDRSLEKAWDRCLPTFLDRRSIPFELQ